MDCESEEMNPLRKDAFSKINQAVSEHFEQLQKDTSYVEAYHNLHTYTKEGKEPETLIAFVTYDMKINGIYTEVPGLATFYVEKTKDAVLVSDEPEDENVQNYIARLTEHQDVSDLFQSVKDAYGQAVQSDALLRERMDDSS